MSAYSDTRGDWPLDRLLCEVIGSGPKSADDMSPEQATEAFHRVLDREADPTTLGAFLLANRWKGNTPEELAAFLDVMRDRSVREAAPRVDPVDCGANYDGKADTALLGVAAGIVAAAAGTPVVVHSADRIPASQGVAYRHVLDDLGVPTDLAPEDSARMVDETGFGFYYAPRFNPEIAALLDRREAMGVRTTINTIETLANPASASVHLGSFFHLSFAKRMIDTLRTAESLDVERIVMLQGLEGYDDIRPGRTTVAVWDDGYLDEDSLAAGDFGLGFETTDLQVPDVARSSARITTEILEGSRTDAYREAVILNAAVRLFAGSDVDSIGKGVDLARSALESGAAADILDELRRFQPSAD